MDFPLRAISAITIPPLYRLGEHSRRLKGSRLRVSIFQLLEMLSRSNAANARRAFESASSQPAYLDAKQLDTFIARYYRDLKTRADRRFPHEKADERANEVLQNVRRWLPESDLKFLDVACGDGLTADAIEKQGGEVTAIDLSDKRFAGSTTFEKMDAAAMRFDDESFDVAYTFDAFEHFSSPDAVLNQIHRVLRPGGLLYASFGPLYNSPHGAHQFLSIDVPYCHLLFREEDCNAAAADRGLRPLTKNLNYWSLRDFRKLFARYEDRFETIYHFEKFNVSFVDLIRQYPSCFRSKVDDFDELIVRSIEVLLKEKKVSLPARRKLLSLAELLAFRDEARQQGRTVVHCHGCFDIVHPGHIHHLQYAKSLGNLLIVSVSADANVNKGVNRPLIPDDLRAGSLAALECVDAVYLNPDPTAAELLEALRPDIYVKGREYERSLDPRFLRERDMVDRFGGRVVFSSGDIVYSSTALIGTLTNIDPFHDEKMRRFCSRYDLAPASLANIVHRFRDLPVVVIGDYILDRYHFCEATGVAGEAPMMALRSIQTKDYDGGAGVIAAHLAGLGAAPKLITALADDELSGQVELRLRSAGVDVLASRHRRQIVAKHRYLVEESKLFKVDDGPVTPLDSRAEELVADQILRAADGAAAVIFADFGYGLITAGLLDRILEPLRSRVPILTADVSGKRSNLLRFKQVDLLCPTEREMRETVQDFSSGLGAVVSKLLTATEAKQALITLGKQGLISFDWPLGSAEDSDGRLRSEYVPALSARTVDPLGCGDALLAAASLTLAAGGSLQAAALLGSIAAGIEVQHLGNHAISAEEILEDIRHRENGLSAARLAS